MDVEVFDVFDLTTYNFLKIQRSTSRGNKIVASYAATGVFKLRGQSVRNDTSETKDSNATLHVRSTETFLSSIDDNLVGHGVEINGKQYEIIGQTGGKNFHDGVMEHYTATLQETKFIDGVSSDS